MAHTLPLHLLLLLVSVVTVAGQQAWTQWKRDDPNWAPWEDFDNSVVVRTYYGDVRGFSVPWHVDDLYWNPDRPDWEEEYPKWFLRRINCFLGIPYARAPVGRFRFQRPKPPSWGGTWEAKYYRHACPQPVEVIRRDIPDFPRGNISEDCLHMNIYAPNITMESPRRLYPVIVWIHSGDFQTGTAQTVPGHVLATQDVIVVTFNYRLGAFGFLTTTDEFASGNWGLYDQHQALSFVKENIRAFRGDPEQITLAGDGSGAASVGFHLVSPMSRGKNFFQQYIMMSGSDMSSFAWVNPYWQPKKYALQLAELLRCDGRDDVNLYRVIECLRDNKTLPWQLFLEAQLQIKPVDGSLGIVFGPTQDSGWYINMPFFSQTPYDMRLTNQYDTMPAIIGINAKDGARIANETFPGLEKGMAREEYIDFLQSMLTNWNVQPQHRERVIEAIEFQYTYWPEPDNRTARAQMFIDMITDMEYGWPIDYAIKKNAEKKPTYMYLFNYQSYSDWVPRWMGASHHGAMPYVFGFPFLNDTVLNETELEMRSYFDYEDRNMSDWMMMMWTNFAKYGQPTLNETRNITWEPFNFNNLSFLIIDEHSHIWGRYRQNKYSFWKEYFPTIATQEYFYATPTPAGYEYIITTGSMSALLILLICGVFCVIYLLWWNARTERKNAEMADSEIPLSFFPGGGGSRETVGKQSPGKPWPGNVNVGGPSSVAGPKGYSINNPSVSSNAPYRMPEPLGPGGRSQRGMHGDVVRPYNYPQTTRNPQFLDDTNPSSAAYPPSYPQSQVSYPPSQRSSREEDELDLGYQPAPQREYKQHRNYPMPQPQPYVQPQPQPQRKPKQSQSRSRNQTMSSDDDSYPYADSEFSSVGAYSGHAYVPRRKPKPPQHSVC